MPKLLRRATSKRKVVRANSNPQEAFVKSKADIVVYGGSAGGGKTFGLIIDPLEHIGNPDFRAVIFRRTLDEITKPNGLWDEARKVYQGFGAKPNMKDLHWTFPSGARIQFDHIQYEETVEKYKSAQIDGIYYDQLETFSGKMFWYMMSRSRSVSGIEPYIRATANPDPDCFLHDDGNGLGTGLISWWIDPKTGYAIPERDRQWRWFVNYEDKLYWGNTAQEVIDQMPESEKAECMPQSIQFIKATVYDNVTLLRTNPRYLGRLKGLQRIDRYRLLGHPTLGGNWNIKPQSGSYFQKSMFKIVRHIPAGITRKVRHWDLAATKKTASNDPDWTCGTLMGIDDLGRIFILDQERFREGALEVERRIHNTAVNDGDLVQISIEQEGSASGVGWPTSIIAKALQGYIAKYHRPPGDKESRAKVLSSQAEIGNVFIYCSSMTDIDMWIREFLNESELFPDATHDDRVDSACGAYERLLETPPYPTAPKPSFSSSNPAFGFGLEQRTGYEYNRPFNEEDLPPDVFRT